MINTANRVFFFNKLCLFKKKTEPPA